MRRKKWTGLQLATTAAMLVAAISVSPAQANTAAVPCYSSNACSSQNSCCGQGMHYLPPEDCLTAGGDENLPSMMR